MRIGRLVCILLAGGVAIAAEEAAPAAPDFLSVRVVENTAYLGRAGLRTLLLEQREAVGGAVGTSEIAPAARVPTLAHTVGRLAPSVSRELKLAQHGQLDRGQVVKAVDQHAGPVAGDVEVISQRLLGQPADARRVGPQFALQVPLIGVIEIGYLAQAWLEAMTR